METESSLLHKKSSSPLPVWSQRIRRLRFERGLSQEKLAKIVGSDVKSIRRWENGEVTPQLYSRQRLAEAFEVTQINLGFLQEVSQEQGRRDDPAIRTPEGPAEESQPAEADGPANPIPVADGVGVTEAAETVSGERPKQRDIRSLWERHNWWLRSLVVVLLIIIIGSCIAGLTYLLLIRPYVQGPEHQPSSLHISESVLLLERSPSAQEFVGN